jgi:hypothetical protein
MCTLTQGYWKTHSIYGPAEYDETWATVGEDTPFFNSGFTWYEIMQLPAENAYIQLAYQYVAAQLNFNAGADDSAVRKYFDQATALLSTYTPAYDWDEDPDNVRAKFIKLAGILDDYNSGVIGPGHCE